MKEPTTHKRVRKTIIAGLSAALKTAANGMPMDQLIDTILAEALAQIREPQKPPEPLPIVVTLRRQSGLGAADALRSLLENREELSSIVREEVQREFKDLGEKYAAMREEAERARKTKRG
jgi:hypothetical protein